MDIWSWISELPNSDDSNSQLTFQLATSIHLKAQKTFGSTSLSVPLAITFSVCYQHKTLWVSDTCPLASDKPFLPLILQLLQETVSRSPTAHDSTCPRSQLQKLKPDPVSWILDSHSPESFSTFFNLIFLTRLFWACVADAPSEVGSMYFNSMLAPNLSAFSCKHAPVLRAFFASIGTDVELCFMRTFGYMLAKWLILKEVGVGLQLVTSLPSHTLGFSYGMESHGLWVLKGYAPILAMMRTRCSGPQYPMIEAKESVLKYALAHQQLEAVIQLEYTVGFHDGFVQVNARVNNLRFHVVKLGFSKNEDHDYVDERHFPSRVRVWIGPEVGASYVAGLTLTRSTENVEREKETQKVLKGSFGKSKIPKMRATARMTTRMRTKNWRWDQDADGNVAIFDGILCDNSTGVEVATWKSSGGSCVEGGDQIGNNFRRRYTGATRAFTKRGGVVFGGEECGEVVGWRLKREMEGSVLKWRIGGQAWLSYWPNEVNSTYFETRCVEWCDEVDLPLINAK